MANGEPATTDQKYLPDDEAARSQLQEQAAGADPALKDPPQVSVLCSRLVTLENTRTSDAAPDLGELQQEVRDSTGRDDIAQCVEGIEQAQKAQASQGQATDSSKGEHRLGDPVMMFNGQYVYTAQDFRINGAGTDFVFARTYKNQTYYEGPLGVNWDHSYNLYIRVEFGGTVLVRSSGELREDRYVLHEQYGYYLPPDGYHDVIVGREHMADYAELLACCADDLAVGHPYSYVLRTPVGSCFLYEQIPATDVHRIRKIRDRFGNYLLFEYDPDYRLSRALVNHPERWVGFRYDERSRITQITAYGITYPWRGGPHERSWRYEYDDLGDLTAVTSPATRPYPTNDPQAKVQGYPSGLTTSYEYNTAYQVGALRHNLVRVTDPAGQLYLENEFGDAVGLLSFNRVVRQRQGRGQFHFEYLDTLPEATWDYSPDEQPAHKTTFYERDGHPIELYYNKAGKLLLRREAVHDRCGWRTLIWRFRYNEDGALVASLSPEGAIVQNYYGREDFYERPASPGDRTLQPARDPRLTAAERLRFGNPLSTVRRGTTFGFLTLIAQLPDRDGFKDFFPRILTQKDPSDIIRKFTYSLDYQQILTASDPRYTTSADPRGLEPPEYAAHLTRYDYDAPPLSLLRQIRHPNTTFPDGAAGLQGVETFRAYDPRGRLVESSDAAGNMTLRHYYPASAGVREGYLLREVRQQANMRLGADAPDMAHLRWSQGWVAQRSCRLSDGAAGRSFEMDFMGSMLVLYQDEDPLVIRGTSPSVAVELIDPTGVSATQTAWDQTQSPGYSIEGLPSGVYTVHLRDEGGAPVSLGRADVFQHMEYEVNEAGLITAVTNARGLRSETIVNELDQAIVTIAPAPFRFKTYSSYNANRLAENVCRELDYAVDGNSFQLLTYKYDEQDKLLAETIGGDTSGALMTRHTYDSSDRRLKTTLPRGNAIQYRYDELGRQVAVIRASCTPEESIVMTIYDGDDRRIASIDSLGHKTRYAYDALGRMVLVEDALGNVKRRTYDKLDNVMGEYTFERRGQQFHLLARSSYEYDELGRMRRQVNYLFRDPIDALAYDPRQIARNPDDPQDFAAFQRALDVGLVSEVCTDLYLDEKGRTIRTSRYGRAPDATTHLLVKTREQVSEQRFDSLDRVVWASDALGNYKVTTYDPNGNVIRTDVHEVIHDPTTGDFEEIFSSLRGYDELDRLRASVDSLGNRTEMRYDSRGNMVLQVDALRNVARLEYDIFGRRVHIVREMTATGIGGVAPEGEVVTHFTYDANGNLTDMVDSKGARMHHEYDMFDRRTSTWYNHPHDPSYQEWRYDPAGLVRLYRDNNGLTHIYTYDDLNRRIETRLDASEIVAPQYRADDADDVEAFVYDALGRIVRESNKHAVIETAYDSLGRSLSEKIWYRPAPPGAVQPLGIDREFDLFSNLTKLTYPGGRQIQYHHDALNRIERVENLVNGSDYPGDPTRPNGYDIAQQEYRGLRLFHRRYANGTGARYFYDGNGRIIAIHHYDASGSLLLEIQQLYDSAGNKRFEIDVQQNLANPGQLSISSERYGYDSLYRLTHYEPAALPTISTAAFQPARAVLAQNQFLGQQAVDAAIGALAQGAGYTYRYDSSGNRLESQEPGGPHRTYDPNELNQYQQVDENGTVVQPVFDPAGNMIGLDVRRYGYNHRHQLARVEEGTTQIARYRYDTRGRLLVASYPNANEQAYFVNDGFNEIAEYRATSAGWACVAQYVNDRNPDSRYQVATTRMEYWYHTNNIQSTRLLTAASGGHTEYEYEPFGSLRTNVPSPWPHNPYLFSGRRYDARSGMYDFRSRSYLPEWGRFLQRDSNGGVDGPNLYRAFGDNPLIFVDPLGSEKTSTPDYRQELNTFELGKNQRLLPDLSEQLKFDRAHLDEPKLPEPPMWRARATIKDFFTGEDILILSQQEKDLQFVQNLESFAKHLEITIGILTLFIEGVIAPMEQFAPMVQMGDVKSVNDYTKGLKHLAEMEGRRLYGTQGKNTALALYDSQTGEVTLQIFGPPAKAGQPRTIIWENKIGRVQIPSGRTPVQIGNQVEEPVRDLVRKATGQNFPSKPANMAGPDLLAPD